MSFLHLGLGRGLRDKTWAHAALDMGNSPSEESLSCGLLAEQRHILDPPHVHMPSGSQVKGQIGCIRGRKDFVGKVNQGPLFSGALWPSVLHLGPGGT